MAPNRSICQVDAITSRSEWLGVLIMVNRASTGHKRVVSDLYAPGLTLLEGDNDGAATIVCGLNRLGLKRTID
ncbi:MAG: hypothetical protein P8N99_01325, partial [Luminiphilus sp.]|nr:hypothetical protein [Luminiphilus sp.]